MQTWITLLFAVGIAAAETQMFPPLEAKNLNGDLIKMPAGFAGDKNLLFIAFKREQQKDIDTWLAIMKPLADAHPNLHYYEIPTIQRMNGMVRFFIDNGMRGGIPDKQQRARTITLYIDKEPFKKSLGLPAEDRIYAVLIDKSGKVLWREEGVHTAQKGKSLQSALSR
jgi:hypothetical protein